MTKFKLYDPVYITSLYGDCTNPSESTGVLAYFTGYGEQYVDDEPVDVYLVTLAEPTSITNSQMEIANIDTIAVHPSNIVPAKWFVNVFRVEDVQNADYQRRTVIKRKSFSSMNEARDYSLTMKDRFCVPGFDISITNLPGQDFPSQAFYDEQKQGKKFLERWRR